MAGLDSSDMYIIIRSENKFGTIKTGFHNLSACSTTICNAPMAPRASVMTKRNTRRQPYKCQYDDLAQFNPDTHCSHILYRNDQPLDLKLGTSLDKQLTLQDSPQIGIKRKQNAKT
jgi:hypothetical protein